MTNEILVDATFNITYKLYNRLEKILKQKFWKKYFTFKKKEVILLYN